MRCGMKVNYGIICLNAFVVLPFLIFSGCAKDNQNLERLTREQAATIQSLNNELTRLNQEVNQVIQARESLAKAKTDLEEKLKNELVAGDMSVSMQERGLVVTVLSSVLFDSGKSDLLESSKESLDKVAEILVDRVGEHMIYVEGHTDNEPIKYSGWRSNWELSTARSTEVVHYFVEQKGVDPHRIAAVGYGEFQPVESNDTAEGRGQNRRVEIVISPKKMGDQSTGAII